MSRHMFTSDLHLGDARVAVERRGFATTEDHDESLLGALAGGLGPDDVLWVLGDLVGTAREFSSALSSIAALPGRKRLVLGNHDPAHPMNRNAFKYTAQLGEVFEWWGTAARTKVCGRDVMVSHFPYKRDHGATRFPHWRLRNEGAWLLHGHTHGAERVTLEPGSREVHVGWDAWGRPVADHEIAKLIEAAS